MCGKDSSSRRALRAISSSILQSLLRELRAHFVLVDLVHQNDSGARHCPRAAPIFDDQGRVNASLGLLQTVPNGATPIKGSGALFFRLSF